MHDTPELTVAMSVFTALCAAWMGQWIYRAVSFMKTQHLRETVLEASLLIEGDNKLSPKETMIVALSIMHLYDRKYQRKIMRSILAKIENEAGPKKDIRQLNFRPEVENVSRAFTRLLVVEHPLLAVQIFRAMSKNSRFVQMQKATVSPTRWAKVRDKIYAGWLNFAAKLNVYVETTETTLGHV
jgi:hypothetical protein